MRTKYSEDFEIFWKKWPGRWNPNKGDYGAYVKKGKSEAFDEWKKLDLEDRRDAYRVLYKVINERYIYLKDCCRWLKSRCWEDYF